MLHSSRSQSVQHTVLDFAESAPEQLLRQRVCQGGWQERKQCGLTVDLKADLGLGMKAELVYCPERDNLWQLQHLMQHVQVDGGVAVPGEPFSLDSRLKTAARGRQGSVRPSPELVCRWYAEAGLRSVVEKTLEHSKLREGQRVQRRHRSVARGTVYVLGLAKNGSNLRHVDLISKSLQSAGQVKYDGVRVRWHLRTLLQSKSQVQRRLE